MCLLTISVKNTQPEVVKLAKNSGFSRLVRDRTFERKVIETSEILENDFGGFGACSCSLNTCMPNTSCTRVWYEGIELEFYTFNTDINRGMKSCLVKVSSPLVKNCRFWSTLKNGQIIIFSS